MPRKSNTRNPLGTIFKKQVIKHGKKIDVWDVRKRTPQLLPNGEPHRDAKNRIIYKDTNQRCYSYQQAVVVLGNMPAIIEEKRQAENKAQLAAVQEKTFFELCEYFDKNYMIPPVYVAGRKVAGYSVRNIPHMRNTIGVMKDFFGDVPLSAIKYSDLVAFADKIAKTPTRKKDENGNHKLPQGSYINKKLGLLRHIFSIAVEDLDWMVKSPFKRGPALIHKSAEKSRTRIMTFDEERRILEMCEEPKRKHLKAFVILAVDTAMRRGEIYQMQWWQVDFDYRAIYLTEEAAKHSKTGVEGVLPMTRRVHDLLSGLKLSSNRTSPKDLVIGRISFKRSWGYVKNKLGIEDLQFRDLRATAITRMLDSGSSGDIVKKISRHSKDTEIFHKHYTRVDLKSAQEIGKKLDEFNRNSSVKVKNKVKRQKT